MNPVSTGYPDIDEFMQEIESTIVKSWKDEVASYFIIYRQRGDLDYMLPMSLFGDPLEDLPKDPETVFYCGYCIFTKPLFEHESWHGLSSAKVHGGVTYGKRFANNVQVYGFDCAHAGDLYDEDYTDINWLTKECEKMSREIIRIYKEEVLRSN